MVALELRFVQEKAEDGQLMYRLDPYVPPPRPPLPGLLLTFHATTLSTVRLTRS